MWGVNFELVYVIEVQIQTRLVDVIWVVRRSLINLVFDKIEIFLAQFEFFVDFIQFKALLLEQLVFQDSHFGLLDPELVHDLVIFAQYF